MMAYLHIENGLLLFRLYRVNKILLLGPLLGENSFYATQMT